MPLSNHHDWIDDVVVSQSPRKGSTIVMDDMVLPPENDFAEISQRPSGINFESAKLDGNENGHDESKDGDEPRPESSSSQCSYQEMNMKEASHADEKEELAAEIADNDAATAFATSDAHAIDVSEPSDLFGGQRHGDVLHEQDPMSMSYYNNGTDQSPFENPFKTDVDMNAVQQLPDDLNDEDNDNDDGNALIEADTNGNHGGSFPLDNQQTVDLLNNQFNTMLIQQHDHQHQEETGFAGAAAYDGGDELTKELLAAESEKQYMDYTEGFEPQASITQVVHELATEVTSVLTEFETHHDHQADSALFGMQPDSSYDALAVNGSSQAFDAESNDNDVIQKSELSVSASEFVPAQKLFEPAAYAESAPATGQLVDTMPLEPEILEQIAESSTTVTEVHDLVESLDTTETKVNEKVEVAAVAAVAVAAATAAVTAAVKSTKSPAKAIDIKKPDLKARATTTTLKKTTATATKAAPAKTGEIFVEFTEIETDLIFLFFLVQLQHHELHQLHRK